MKNVISFLLAVYLTSTSVMGQSKAKSNIDCNTIFVCIKQEDYTTLFKNSFVKDTLFFCKENTTKTYNRRVFWEIFYGRICYTIEFLQPSKKQ
jgi:hypothetical protein